MTNSLVIRKRPSSPPNRVTASRRGAPGGSTGWNRIDAFFRAWTEAGFQPVGHLVWAKSYASSRRFLEARHEQAYLLAKGHPRKPDAPLSDVRPWEYTGNVAHPTEKAVSILRPLVESFSTAGGTVLDPFAGSGSTLVAAALSGRSYVGIELEEEYCQLARRRLAVGVPNFVNWRLNGSSAHTGSYAEWCGSFIVN